MNDKFILVVSKIKVYCPIGMDDEKAGIISERVADLLYKEVPKLIEDVDSNLTIEIDF